MTLGLQGFRFIFKISLKLGPKTLMYFAFKTIFSGSYFKDFKAVISRVSSQWTLSRKEIQIRIVLLTPDSTMAGSSFWLNPLSRLLKYTSLKRANAHSSKGTGFSDCGPRWHEQSSLIGRALVKETGMRVPWWLWHWISGAAVLQRDNVSLSTEHTRWPWWTPGTGYWVRCCE